jgi:hypothetical protein
MNTNKSGQTAFRYPELAFASVYGADKLLHVELGPRLGSIPRFLGSRLAGKLENIADFRSYPFPGFLGLLDAIQHLYFEFRPGLPRNRRFPVLSLP